MKISNSHLIFITILLDQISRGNGYSVHSMNKKLPPRTSSISISSTGSGNGRRSFLAIPAISLVPLLIDSREATALQPKNEVLCGTGFFEHIYEYKCTAIGDIQDEGNVKDLSAKEVDVADSLMRKFGLSEESSFSNGERGRKAAETTPLQENEGRKNAKKTV